MLSVVFVVVLVLNFKLLSFNAKTTLAYFQNSEIFLARPRAWSFILNATPA